MSEKEKLKKWFSENVDQLPDDITVIYALDDFQNYDKTMHRSGVSVIGASRSVPEIEISASFIGRSDARS